MQRKQTRTRIQERNEARIVTCALSVFSSYGYRGATLEQIASAAGMSKANILYYFSSKLDIYEAVLENAMATWLEPLDTLDPDADPIVELLRYVEQNLQLSRSTPLASMLLANEILQGAPVIKPFLQTELKVLVEKKCRTIQAWINDGKIKAIDPQALLFLIWSSTQHYANFRTQIDALCEHDDNRLFEQASQTLHLIITRTLTPDISRLGDES